MSTSTAARQLSAKALVAVALACAVALGTFGTLMIGFGTGTDCDTWYEICGADDCPPCRGVDVATGANALLQLAVAALCVVLLVRGGARVVVGLALLVVTVGGFAVASAGASSSYCRPDDEWFTESYCPGAPGPSDGLSPPGSG